jgi:superfamily II DNA or RNA helicase
MTSAEKLQRLLGTFPEKPKAKGDAFEDLMEWLWQNHPLWKESFTKVVKWKDWDGYKADGTRLMEISEDLGVDFVADTHDGKCVAIQVKNYSEETSLTYGKLATFLAKATTFDDKYLFATVNPAQLSRHAKKELMNHNVHKVLRPELESYGIDWPESIENLRPAKPIEKRNLRPDQVEAVHAIAGMGERGRYLAPPGAGKTTVALSSIAEMKAQKVLFLVPSLFLVKQVIEELPGIGDMRWLAVASDRTIGNGASKEEEEEFVNDIPYPVTTDENQIANFLKQDSTKPQIIISTYQSSEQIGKAQNQLGVPQFDLVIADEAHKTAGRLSGPFAYVLHDNKIKTKRRLFMTATPRLLRAPKGQENEIVTVASMDNENIYGPIVYELGMRKAIDELQILCDYQVLVVGIDDENILDIVNGSETVLLDNKREAKIRQLVAQVALHKAIAEKDLQSIATFHSRTAAAREFVRTFKDQPTFNQVENDGKDIRAEAIDGTMLISERTVRLNSLRNPANKSVQIVSSARVLSEGVDVPALNAVVFVDPRESKVDIVQTIGRALRYAPGKTGYIILPIPLYENDVQGSTAGKSYQTIIDVLLALREVDTSVAEELDVLRGQLRRAGFQKVNSKHLAMNLPTHINSKALADEISLRILRSCSSFFHEKYSVLQCYAKEYGTANVPQYTVYDNSALGNWVSTQRGDYKNKKLVAERIVLLEALPGWTWNTLESQFANGLEKTQAYAQEYGTANVPSRNIYDNFALGRWIAGLRQDYKKEKLSPEKIAAFEALPGWTWNTRESRFSRGLEKARDYVQKYGTIKMTMTTVHDDFALGQWISDKRRDYKNGMLSTEKIAQLEAVPGWTWDSLEAQFSEGVKKLRDYAQEYGKLKITMRTIYEDFPLGKWISERRDDYKKGKLSTEKITLLEALSGWSWDGMESQFLKGFEKLEAYTKAHGTANVRQYTEDDNFNLGNWISRKRRDYKKGKLSQEKIAMLEELPGWSWDPLANKMTIEKNQSKLNVKQKRNDFQFEL